MHGPKILLNSIPKAGTNLLLTTIKEFPGVLDPSRRTIRGWKEISPQTLSALGGIKKGTFETAHLTWSAEAETAIKNQNIKHIFIIRDPRDIVVSQFKYISNIDSTHPAHDYFRTLKDDDERLMTSITGMKGVTVPIGEVLDQFGGWLGAQNTLVLKFEDLIGEKGGGAEEVQIRTVQRIAEFLEIPLDKSAKRDISSRVFSEKSLTFNKGSAGGWKKYFKDSHIKQFENQMSNREYDFGY